MPARPEPKRRATPAQRATQEQPVRTDDRPGRPRPSRRAPVSKVSALPTSVVLGAAAMVVAGTGAIAVSASASADSPGSPYPTLSADLSRSIVDQTPGKGADTRSKDAALDRSQPISRTFERDLTEISQDNLAEQSTVRAKQRSSALAELAEQTQKQTEQSDSSQWVLPIAGYTLTARFGESSGLWATVHTGLDFAAPSGTPLVAVADGTITAAGYASAYGNQTILTLEDGTEIWYCHQTSYAVKPGQTVRPGQLIGYVGSTGNTTGPHLHLEVRPGGGDPVDPYQALTVHGVRP